MLEDTLDIETLNVALSIKIGHEVLLVGTVSCYCKIPTIFDPLTAHAPINAQVDLFGKKTISAHCFDSDNFLNLDVFCFQNVKKMRQQCRRIGRTLVGHQDHKDALKRMGFIIDYIHTRCALIR